MNLAWNASPSPDVVSYHVRYGTSSGNYSSSTNLGTQLLGTVLGLQPGQTYYFVVVARDSAGNESPPSNEVSYQVPGGPLLPPVVLLTSPLAGLTFNAPATINLAASVTANGHTINKVQFHDGTTLIGEDTTAPYSYTWNNVGVGLLSLTATAVYDTTNSLTSLPVPATVLLAGPTVSVTSPANGASFTAPAAITLSASVVANGNLITKVQFYNGATFIGEDSVAPYSIGWNNVGSGNYSVSARVVYGLGSTVDSSVVNLSVLPAPTIALNSPANGAGYTAPAAITIGASCLSNGRDLNKVQFYNGATLLGEDPVFPFEYTWSNVPAGSYNVRAVLVYDGTNSLSSTTASVSVTNAAAPVPAVSLTAPANGGSFTAPASVSLAATVVSNGNAITKVQFYNGGTLLHEDLAPPYAYTWSSVAAGSYSVSARVVYGAGSTANSASAAITVTNPAPTISLTAPANGSGYTAIATVNLAATVVANGNTISGVQFYCNATLLNEDTTAPYSYSWTGVAPGNYSVTARVIYGSGSGVSSSAAMISVTNALPAVAMTSPGSGSSYGAPASIDLGASVTPNGHTITKVEFYQGTTLLGEDVSAPYAFTWNNVSSGSYNVSARVTYDSGSTRDSSAISVSVTNVPLPTVALSSPVAGASYLAPATINLAASVNANGHTITKVQFYHGTTLVGEAPSAPYSFTWSNVGSGSYNFLARVIYGSGSSVDSTSVNVAVTNAPLPTVALSSPIAGATLSAPATINLAASVTANGHSITKVQFYQGSTLLGEAPSAPYGLTWSNVSSGDYFVSARVVYDSGSTVDSDLVDVHVTTEILPTISLTSPTQGATLSTPATLELTSNVASNGHAVAGVIYFNGSDYIGESYAPPYAFSWAGVPPGQYRITARAVLESSAVDSAPVDVSVVNLPPPWQTADIGSVGLKGSATELGGLFTVRGAGVMGSRADHIRYVFQTLSGNGEIVVRLNSLTNASLSGRSGIMIRETLSPGSKYVFVGLSPDKRYRWQRRSTTGGSVSASTSGTGYPPNTWLKLVRTSNNFYGYKSTNGINWSLINSRSLAMASNIHVGLVVASANTNAFNTSTFGNVSVVP